MGIFYHLMKNFKLYIVFKTSSPHRYTSIPLYRGLCKNLQVSMFFIDSKQICFTGKHHVSSGPPYAKVTLATTLPQANSVLSAYLVPIQFIHVPIYINSLRGLSREFYTESSIDGLVSSQNINKGR